MVIIVKRLGNPQLLNLILLTQKEIRNILGCSDSNISAILRGKSWKQVDSSTTIPEGSTSK